MKLWVLALFFVVGLVLGFNIALISVPSKYLWNKDRDGLEKVMEQMKKDKSERLGACFQTRINRYAAQSVSPEEAQFVCGFAQVKNASEHK